MAFNNEFTQVENSWAPAGTSRPNTFTAPQIIKGDGTAIFPLNIVGNSVTQVETNTNYYSGATSLNPGLQVVGNDTGTAPFVNSFYGANQFIIIGLNRCNGTYASKTDLLNNQTIGEYSFYGMKTTQAFVRYCGGIAMITTENWAATQHGSQMQFTVYENTTGSVRRSYIRNNGVLEPGFGIRFGTTGLSILSTYEEGTWTPAIRSTGATFSLDATETVGRYTRIGKMVFVEFAIQLSGATTGTLTNQIFIQNLPFTPQLLGTKSNWRPVLAYEGFTIGYANGGLVANLSTSTEFAVTSVRDVTTMGVITASMFTGSGARICGGFSFQVA